MSLLPSDFRRRWGIHVRARERALACLVCAKHTQLLKQGCACGYTLLVQCCVEQSQYLAWASEGCPVKQVVKSSGDNRISKRCWVEPPEQDREAATAAALQGHQQKRPSKMGGASSSEKEQECSSQGPSPKRTLEHKGRSIIGAAPCCPWPKIQKGAHLVTSHPGFTGQMINAKGRT